MSTVSSLHGNNSSAAAVDQQKLQQDLTHALMGRRSPSEQTPLKGHPSIQELLNSKAKPTSLDLTTAIFAYSDATVNELVVRLLLNANAAPTSHVVMDAVNQGYEKTAALLLQHTKAPLDDCPSSLLESAISKGFPPAVIAGLVDQGVPVGQNSLYSAARLSADSVVQHLIGKGAKLSRIENFTTAQDYRNENEISALTPHTKALLLGTISTPAETVAQGQAEVLQDEEDQEVFERRDERPAERSCWSYLLAPFIAVWSCVASIFSCIWSSLCGDTVDLSDR